MQEFYAVHQGHKVVAENQMVAVLPRHFEGLLAAVRGVYLDAGLFEQALQHGEVHRHVVNNEDTGRWCLEALFIGV